MSAAAIAVAHSRSLFQLDEPVATYWPEFAQQGKGQVTAGTRRRSGGDDQPLDLAIIGDPDALGAVLAAQAPKWPPEPLTDTTPRHSGGTKANCFDESIRLADPSARFADEVAARSTHSSSGYLTTFRWSDSLSSRAEAVCRSAARIRCPGVSAGDAEPAKKPARLVNPKALAMNMTSINRSEVLRLSSLMNGVGEVAAIAKVYEHS